MNDWIQKIISYIVKLPLLLSIKVNMEKRRKLDFNQYPWGQVTLNKDVEKDNFTKN